MVDLKKIRQFIAGYGKRKVIKTVFILIAGSFLFLASLEIYLNFHVRRSLRESMGWGSDPQVKIKARLNWLSLFDVLRGRVRWIKLQGENCRLSNLRFTKIELSNEGFKFNLPVLLKERRLVLLGIEDTSIKTVVSSEEFTEYMNFYYPQFQPSVRILPGKILLAGQTHIFHQTVPVELLGKLIIASPKTLRFLPLSLSISGRSFSKSFIEFIRTQIPLEFSLMKEWPLAVHALELKDGFVMLTFQELPMVKR